MIKCSGASMTVALHPENEKKTKKHMNRRWSRMGNAIGFSGPLLSLPQCNGDPVTNQKLFQRFVLLGFDQSLEFTTIDEPIAE